MMGIPHASSKRSPTVRSADGSSSWKIGSISRPNPVATISSPLRLSGLRRQAINPQAVNAPPIRRKTIR